MTTQTQEQWVALTASDGHYLDAFKVVPPTTPRGTVIVLQEIFGVNSHIQHVARRIAAEGYVAIAPALFDRIQKGVNLTYSQDGIQDGLKLKGAVSLDNALLDVAAALEHAGDTRTAATLGFCWGGTLAWLSSAKLPVRAAVSYYGGQIGAHLDVKLQTPVLTHFGEDDHSIPITVANDISEWYPTVINHTYPAGHGFNCDERGSFKPDCAALAWQRTTGFLKAVL